MFVVAQAKADSETTTRYTESGWSYGRVGPGFSYDLHEIDNKFCYRYCYVIQPISDAWIKSGKYNFLVTTPITLSLTGKRSHSENKDYDIGVFYPAGYSGSDYDFKGKGKKVPYYYALDAVKLTQGENDVLEFGMHITYYDTTPVAGPGIECCTCSFIPKSVGTASIRFTADVFTYHGAWSSQKMTVEIPIIVTP